MLVALWLYVLLNIFHDILITRSFSALYVCVRERGRALVLVFFSCYEVLFWWTVEQRLKGLYCFFLEFYGHRRLQTIPTLSYHYSNTLGKSEGDIARQPT